MTTPEQVIAALADAPKGDDNRISYPSLLRTLKANGVQPRAMNPVLEKMERDGLIEQTAPDGSPWLSVYAGGEDQDGPLYIRRSSDVPCGEG